MCECDCGNKIIVRADSLNNHTKSCGCLKKEVCRKYNDYKIFNNTVFVKFTNCNEYFLCDLEDWNNLKQHCWLKSKGYAVSRINGKVISFHKLIMQCKKGMYIDHIFQVSRGVCDNRKDNLRIVTKQQNAMNSKLNINNTSGYKGVYWDKKHEKWLSQITYNKKNIHLGYFDDIEKAIKARADAELKYFGEYRNRY